MRSASSTEATRTSTTCSAPFSPPRGAQSTSAADLSTGHPTVDSIRTPFDIRPGRSIDRPLLPLYTDGLGHPGSTGLRFGGSARTTLRAGDSTILDRAVAPVFGSIAVPAGTAGYTLSADLNQNPNITDVSSKITSTWTFRSATVPNGTQRIPLLNVRYSPGLTADTSAPAGRPVIVPVTVEGASRGVRTLTVEVSYDAGKTWQQTPLSLGHLLLLRPPADAAAVSLRAKVSDGRGNTADQTIIRAFKITS